MAALLFLFAPSDGSSFDEDYWFQDGSDFLFQDGSDFIFN